MTKVSCFLALVIAFCLALPALASANAVNSQQGYSSRDLFEGVFLGKGPVVKVIPELKSDARLLRQADVAKLEDEIAKADHGYFNSIGLDLTSGDPGRVKHAIAKTGIVLRRIHSKLVDSDGTKKNVGILALLMQEAYIYGYRPEKHALTAELSGKSAPDYSSDNIISLIAMRLAL